MSHDKADAGSGHFTRSERGLVVEFIGLPGSGKTTLRQKFMAGLAPAQAARYLTEEAALMVVARRNIDAVFRAPLKLLPPGLSRRFLWTAWWRSSQRWTCTNRFLARHGAALGAFTLSPVYHAMSTLDRFRVIESFLETGAIHEFLDDSVLARHVVLFGEGLVQKSFMFVDRSETAGRETDVVRYLGGIPLPDLLINVRVSAEQAFGRMAGRASGLTQRLKSSDKETVQRFLGKAARHLDLLSGWFAANYPARMLTIENHCGIESAVDVMRERLLRF